MNDTFLSVNFNTSVDDDTHFISCNAEVLIVDIDRNVEYEIGNADLYLINVFRYLGWSDVIYFADSVSGDLYEIVEILAPILEMEDQFLGKLAVLDSITIKEEYRGQGYGSKALTEIMKYLEILSFDYLALSPFPVEEKQSSQLQKLLQELIDYYERFGFKVVSEKNNKQHVMGKNLNIL